jgi:hypothetical protein
MGVGVLLDMSCHLTEIKLEESLIMNEGASLLARALGKNALPNLTRLFIYNGGIGDDR